MSGPLFGVAERASALALRHHDAVVTIGRCMARRMVALGVPGERITVVPNWADPRIHPVPHANNPFRHQNGLCDGFIVAYSGNLGLAHPMDGVLDAAAELGRTDPDVAILVIGEGRGLPSLVEAVTARGLRNVRFLPFQPAEGLSESLSAADLHLATMDRRAEGLLVPSKISGALAAGRPCLFLGPAGSEAAALVSGCGRVLDPRDGPGLAAAVRVYARDPALCAEEGRRAVATASTWNADAAARSFSALAEAVRKPSARSMNGGAGRSLPHA